MYYLYQESIVVSSVKCICKNCKNEFDYPLKEFNRQTKRFKRKKDDLFCSLSCVRIWNNKNRSSEVQEKISKALSIRSKNNKYNRKGNFTYFLNKIRNKKHGKAAKLGFNIDESYLTELWENQNHKCALTGIEMMLRVAEVNSLPTTVSIDRIDSDIGYVKGNIQLICHSINLAKNDFTNDEIINFIKLLK